MFKICKQNRYNTQNMSEIISGQRRKSRRRLGIREADKKEVEMTRRRGGEDKEEWRFRRRRKMKK